MLIHLIKAGAIQEKVFSNISPRILLVDWITPHYTPLHNQIVLKGLLKRCKINPRLQPEDVT